MHETGIVKSLIREVEKVARQYGAPRVVSVRVEMGVLCPFSEAHLREHFAREVQGTALQDARLVIEHGRYLTDPRTLEAHAQDVMLLSIDLEHVVPVAG